MQVESQVTTLTDIETVLNGLVLNQIKSISDSLVNDLNAAIIALLLTLYVAFRGYKMMMGTSEMTIDGLLWLIVKVGGLYILALNSENIGWEFAELIYKIPDHLVNLVVAGINEKTYTGNMSFLDQMMAISFDAYRIEKEYAYSKASFGIPDIAAMAMALLMLGVGLLAGIMGANVLFLAKFFLAVLLAIAPLFILMLIFEVTHSFFMSYVAYIFNVIMMSVLGAVAIRMAFGLVKVAIDSSPDTVGDENYLSAFWAVPVVYGIAMAFFKAIPSIAAGLSGSRELSFGGAAVATHNALRGGARVVRGGGTVVVDRARKKYSDYKFNYSKRNEVSG